MSDGPAIAPGAVALRPATEEDTEFLLEVYTGTRLDELAATDWDEAQSAHYQTYYPTAERSVILIDGTPAGRLYADRWEREIRIMDIALLPDFRGKGTGTFLLTKSQHKAAADGKLLSIHVERHNPALSLYVRLGFVLAEDKGAYLLLHWLPTVT